MSDLSIDHTCQVCGAVTKAYPDKQFDAVGWCDYEGNRTNMVSIRFRSEHHCPTKEDSKAKTGPVEVIPTSSLKRILDTLYSMSTPPQGVPDDVRERIVCSETVRELYGGD